MKGYHNDRFNQSDNPVCSRRNLIRAAVIGIPALALISASASAREDSAPTGAVAAPTTLDNMPVDGHLDVGGRQLHIYGTGSGGPTVILEAGYGDDWSTWRLVQPMVAEYARVYSYDRAGIGESDPAPIPRTAADVVADLHALLTAAAVPGPYVLVGASFGGMVVRLFASAYPDEVVGLVLSDAVHEDYFDRLQAIAPEQTARLTQLLASMPEGVDLSASCAQVRDAAPIPAVPMVVIVGGQPDFPPLEPNAETESLWQELARDMATLTSDTHLMTADRSGHAVNRYQPEIVTEAIRRVVDAVRTPTSWTADA